MIAERSANNLLKWLTYALIALVLSGLEALVLLYFRHRIRPTVEPPERVALPQPITRLTVTGLSEAEAAARLGPGQDNLIQRRARRTRRQLIREGTLTIFNLNLVGLGFVQVLLGRPLDALITAGILLFNIGVTVFQEEFARYRIQGLQETIRPQTTAIRDGRPRSIDSDQIVVGDALSAGPGDQIMVDGVVGQGQVQVDESLLSGNSAHLPKQPGDPLYAGSICVSGQAVYQAEKTGEDRLIVERLREGSDSKEELTPIEKIMNRVMRVLLIIVTLLAAVLVARYFRLDTLIYPVEDYIDAVSVVFNLAPAGLFLMVVLTYVAATADLAQSGALVHRARSVESLAQVNAMCFAKAGILTGTTVQIRPAPAAEETSPPDEETLQQMLGDFSRSISTNNLVVQAMKTTFAGTQRPVQAEAALMSVYGWSALAFNDTDLQGTYVLCDPQLLSAADQITDEPLEEEEGNLLSKVSPTELGKQVVSLTQPLGRLFKWGRNDDQSPASESSRSHVLRENEYSDALRLPHKPDAEHPNMRSNAEHWNEESDVIHRPSPPKGRNEEGPSAKESPASQEAPSGGLFGRFRQRMTGLLSLTQVEVETPEPQLEADAGATILAFAYTPEITSFYNDEGEPQLPQDLTPLCYLSYREQIRPEAIEAIKTFTARQVEVKIFTPDTPDKTLALIKQADLSDDDTDAARQVSAITGPELAALEPAQWVQAVKEHTIYGRVSPQQSEQIVRALRQAGRSVGVIGDGVSDVSAMRQANLALTRRNSSPAALTVADIILLNDSPLVLPGVVDKGQRIVNGLLDVLKLYLTQVFYLLLLIGGIPLVAYGFPYSSAQGGVVALLTLTIPAIGLSLWAAGGSLPAASLGRVLTHFVSPAAVTMALAGLAVYVLFLRRSGETEYAQLALTYALVAMGLLLVVFIKPPVRFALSSLPTIGDLRPTILVMVSALLFVVMTYIPLAQRFFEIAPLRQPSHYLVVGIAVAAWALGVRFLWLVIPLQRRVRTSVLSRMT